MKFSTNKNEFYPFCTHILLAPVVGAFCEMWKAEYMAAVGAFLFSAGVLFCAVATNLLQLYLSFGIVSGIVTDDITYYHCCAATRFIEPF